VVARLSGRVTTTSAVNPAASNSSHLFHPSNEWDIFNGHPQHRFQSGPVGAMNIFPRRREAQRLSAQHDELAARTETLRQVLAGRLPGPQSRVVISLGPKGGGNATTGLAGVALAMAPHLARLAVVADFNPAKGTMVLRLRGEPDPQTRRLFDLATEYPTVIKPGHLAEFLDTAGRLHLAHNVGVTDQLVDQITFEQHTGILAVLRDHAQFVFVDTGNTLVSPSMTAALDAADHAVIGALTSVGSLRTLYQGLTELKASGHKLLIDQATMVVGVDNPSMSAAAVDELLDWYRGTCSHVEVLPHDPALVSGGLITWDGLAITSRIGFTRAAINVARSLYAGGHDAPGPAWPGAS